MGAWKLMLGWLVVANHTSGLRQISTNLEIGKVAVSTFFFISGFLMPLTFLTHYRAYGMLDGSLQFYVNRFPRIYPIYWASLTVILLAVLHCGPTLMEHARTLEDLSRPRTYLSNILLRGRWYCSRIGLSVRSIDFSAISRIRRTYFTGYV
jgi:peptidoglycan/LPS O-acetylase OafA/YrhL